MSRTIAAVWLCAISCAKVSDTAEQNGQAVARCVCPTSIASAIAVATQTVPDRDRVFLMATF